MRHKVTIREMDLGDIAMVHKWRNDPRVRKYMFNSHPIEFSGHVEWFNSATKNPLRCLVLACHKDIPFGFAQFDISVCGTVADWGFYVDPDGPKGKGALMGQEVLNFGFSKLGFYKVCARVLANNSKSLAYHKRLGFTPEGILRSHHLASFGHLDVHLFGILATEWIGQKTLVNKVEKCE